MPIAPVTSIAPSPTVDVDPTAPDPWAWVPPEWRSAPLTPEETALIEMDAPPAAPLTPEETALIEMDAPPAAPEVEPYPGELAPPERPLAERLPAWLQPRPEDEPELAARLGILGDIEPGPEADVSIEAQIAEDAARLAALPPEHYALEQAKTEIARENLRRTRLLEATTASARQAAADARIYQDAIAQAGADRARLDAESRELATRQIESGRWLATRSGLQTVAAYVAAIAGGLASARSGGRNSGLDMILKAIDDDIEIQRANLAGERADLASRRNAVAEAAAQSGDLYDAMARVRAATLEATAQQVETEIANLDPHGTQARDLATALVGIRQAHEAALADYERQQQELLLRTIPLEQKQQEIDLARARFERERYRGGGGAARPPEWYAAMGYEAPPVAMSPREYDAHIRRLKAGQEAAGGERTAGLSREEMERGITDPVTGEPLRHTVDGTDRAFIARGDASSINAKGGLRDRVASGYKVASAIDNVIALRARKGWSSNLWKSPEWQRIKQSFASAQTQSKEVLGLGALSGPDMDLVNAYLGGADPTGVRDPTPGLEAARAEVLANMNADLRAAGYRGAPISFPDLAHLPARFAVPEEASLKAQLPLAHPLLRAGRTFDVLPTRKAVEVAAELLTRKGLIPSGMSPAEQAEDVERGFSRAQGGYAIGLAARLASPDPDERERARAALEGIRDSADADEYRDLARRILKAAEP